MKNPVEMEGRKIGHGSEFLERQRIIQVLLNVHQHAQDALLVGVSRFCSQTFFSRNSKPTPMVAAGISRYVTPISDRYAPSDIFIGPYENIG